MNKITKIISTLCLFLLSVAFVKAQGSANSIALATIVNPVGLQGMADEEIQVAGTLGTYYNMINNPGNPLSVLPKLRQLLQKNVESGNLVVSAANEDTYSITTPASVIFHRDGYSNYLRGNLFIAENGASNTPIKLQMDLYAEGQALPGKYSSLPAEIIVNFN